MKTMSFNKGFTLIELMTTVAVLAIVLTLGIPGFRAMILNNRMATQTNELISALNLARSEAITRGVRVTLCKSSDLASCTTSGNWDQGWIVFVDRNNDATVSDVSLILRTHAGLGGSSLSGNTNIADYVSYVPSGFTQLTTGGFQAGTFTLCPGSSGSKGRSIVLSATGRPKVSDATCS